MKAKTKNLKQKGFLGVSSMIKLPFVIGTNEFEKHPFAGLVFCGLGSQLEQEDHLKEEEQQLLLDKQAEEKQLEAN